jgi:hypothetical protein
VFITGAVASRPEGFTLLASLWGALAFQGVFTALGAAMVGRVLAIRQGERYPGRLESAPLCWVLSPLIRLPDAGVFLTCSEGVLPGKEAAEMFLDYPKKGLDDGRHCHLLILHDVDPESNLAVSYRNDGEAFLS